MSFIVKYLFIYSLSLLFFFYTLNCKYFVLLTSIFVLFYERNNGVSLFYISTEVCDNKNLYLSVSKKYIKGISLKKN